MEGSRGRGDRNEHLFSPHLWRLLVPAWYSLRDTHAGTRLVLTTIL